MSRLVSVAGLVSTALAACAPHHVAVSTPTGDRLVSPAALAHASGPGLAGATVTQVLRDGDRLLVGTAEAGLATWDGTQFLPVPLGGAPTVHVLANGPEDVPWAGTSRGLWSLGPEPTLQHNQPTSDVLTHDGHTWWLDGAGAVRDLTDPTPLLTGCTALWLLPGPSPLPMASCDRVRRLPSGSPWEALPGRVPVHSAVARVDGVWLAEADGLRAIVRGMEVDGWQPPAEGTVTSMALHQASLLVATGEAGLWRLTPEGPEAVPTAHGLPSPTVTTVVPGPNHKAWVGTGAGLALLDPQLQATALPLAPGAAGPLDRGVALSGALATLGPLGLQWLGTRPPKGFPALVAAVGDQGFDLSTSADGSLWVLRDTDVVQLDPHGALHRWPLHALTLGLSPLGQGMLFHTEAGAQVWVPGARQLSGARPAPSGTLLGVDHAGIPWWSDGTDLLLGWPGTEVQHRWVDLGMVHAWEATATGVLLGTDDGLFALRPTADRPTPLLPEVHAPVVALEHAAGHTWAATSDGTLWHLPPEGAPRVQVLPDDLGVLRFLHADGPRLWLGTDRGAWQLLPADAPR